MTSNGSYKRALFIFRRDLRVQDNLGLIQALEASETVIPIFIFDPRQCRDHPYLSSASLRFLLESLDDLRDQLKPHQGNLNIYYGECERVLEDLLSKNSIDAVYFNLDYTPFSRHRDENIRTLCQQHSIDCHAVHDALLIPPGQGLKQDGKPYLVFTPFYRHVRQQTVPLPILHNHKNFDSNDPVISAEYTHAYEFSEPKHYSPASRGGRAACLERLEALWEAKNYQKTRNFPALASTTLLSPHLKFTTCSVREIYHAILERTEEPEELLRELYWRDFFTHIAYHFPHVFGQAFHAKFNNMKWDNNPKYFQAWCEGQTGFPIIDAGMRQLNQTGHMHNRVRMLTASFLIKDLHIDWRWGERYFANKLVDYDPAVNNGNWQWVAGTGTDAQPYYRIFNPWLQQQKFDPECEYIKQWVPELQQANPEAIHAWADAPQPLLFDYPIPMVDHKVEAQRAKHQHGS